MDQTLSYVPSSDPVALVRQLTSTNVRQAQRILACFELGQAYSARGAEPEKITRPVEAYRQVKSIGGQRTEHLVALYLNAQNFLLSKETISIGSLNTTRTHPREILWPAVTRLSFGFILAHNHPSGCLDPSDEDVAFSKAVQRAGELLGIELFDHLIVTRDGFTSLRERGVL